ncbi:HicB family protein [Blastopirellula retiformator]|uniref:HicB family protein n=2 Tax=Blastopirellula retiformator TaxID=2527970 RepID=A0A5C5UY10_9BACT|nr:HicB family protein [Blastopirellula retiformator]
MKKLSDKKVRDFTRVVDQAIESTTGWESLWNAVGGIGGALSQLFPTPAERTQLQDLDAWQRLWEEIRSRQGGNRDEFIERTADASGTLSLRLPKSLHAALKVEAEAEGVSINQLILAKCALQLSAACRG